MKKVIFGALALSMIMFACQKEVVKPELLISKEKSTILNIRYIENSFIDNLQQKINLALNNELIITDDIENEYTSFAIDNKDVVVNMNSNIELYDDFSDFYYQYKNQMNLLGYTNDFLEPYEGFSIDIVNTCESNQTKFQTELNKYYNVSDFSNRVFHTIYDGLKVASNTIQKKTIFNSAYNLIMSSNLFDTKQKDYFKRGLTTGFYFIGYNIGNITAGNWYDCLGFAASAVGAVLGGPVGAGLGIIGMATAAPGCESYLGW